MLPHPPESRKCKEKGPGYAPSPRFLFRSRLISARLLSQGVAYLLAIFGEALHRNPGKEAAQINDAESQGAFGFLPLLAAQLGVSQGTGLVAHLEAQAHGLVQDITACDCLPLMNQEDNAGPATGITGAA